MPVFFPGNLEMVFLIRESKRRIYWKTWIKICNAFSCYSQKMVDNISACIMHTRFFSSFFLFSIQSFGPSLRDSYALLRGTYPSEAMLRGVVVMWQIFVQHFFYPHSFLFYSSVLLFTSFFSFIHFIYFRQIKKMKEVTRRQ